MKTIPFFSVRACAVVGVLLALPTLLFAGGKCACLCQGRACNQHHYHIYCPPKPAPAKAAPKECWWKCAAPPIGPVVSSVPAVMFAETAMPVDAAAMQAAFRAQYRADAQRQLAARLLADIKERQAAQAKTAEPAAAKAAQSRLPRRASETAAITPAARIAALTKELAAAEERCAAAARRCAEAERRMANIEKLVQLLLDGQKEPEQSSKD